MAGPDPLLIKLQRVLQTLDDDALATLANRGLLRRARKDLEAETPQIRGVEGESVEVELGGETVRLAEHPANSRCTCPAPGVCRHVLAALLHLRDASPTSDETVEATDADGHEIETLPSPAEVFANLGDKELQKWAGKPLIRKATRYLASGPKVEIEADASLVVRFPDRNVTCRWIPSGQLTGMLCSCQAETVCEHVVAAVLAYQASLGKRHVELEETVLQEAAGAPRSRTEVLESVGTVLREIVSLGLARLSVASAQRLTTLAVSAHGVDLPRLERMLRSLANQIDLALRRDAQSSTTRLLAQLARTEALRLGLTKSQPVALVGQHRSQYFEVGQITLVGLGAQSWRSKGGYQGLTVYFWDQSQNAWATWSDSRPANQTGFSPEERFLADGPWDGCDSPKEASRSILRLTRAWRNGQGRLSGRPATRATVMGSSQPREIPDATGDWSLLADKAARLYGGGLTTQTENLDLVLLFPSEWGPSQFDPLRQELRQTVLDDHGRAIDLWLPFTPEQEKAVEQLESFQPGESDGLLGMLHLVSGVVCVRPISVFLGNKIISLNLEDAIDAPHRSKRRKKPKANNRAPENEIVETDEVDLVSEATAATPLGRILIAAQAELEAIAESGVAVRRDGELLASAVRRLETIGLTTCSRPLGQFQERLVTAARQADSEGRNEAAGLLLHAYYLLRLAADQETLAMACAGLREDATS